MSAERKRFLFFLLHSGYVRYYGRTFELLAERGHDVRLAFSQIEKDAGDVRLADELVAAHPSISYGLAPQRERSDGWRPLVGLVRSLADYARYIHPRYADAPVLRARIARKLLGAVDASERVDPVSARVVRAIVGSLESRTSAQTSERLIRLLARLERAIPTSRAIDAFVRDAGPDAVVATPVIDFGSSQVEYLKSAARLGIPCGVAVASWDNLTGKGLLRVVPDRVFVWNETQREEARDLHGIPAERVVATGSPKFDEWFERRPSTTAAALEETAGLDPAAPYLLYVCSSPFIAPDEVPFVRDWLAALRASGVPALESIGVLVRPHPQNGEQWRDAELSTFGNVTIWPRQGNQPDAGDARAAFFDSLAHSAAVVGINTSAMIEAAILGKSVLSVVIPPYAATQDGTLHFRYLLHENGGFLHVARSLEEHTGQLAGILADGDAHAGRTLAFVERFVRPRGLDRAATPILLEELEQLASLSVAPVRPRLGDRVVAALLTPLAAAAGLGGTLQQRRSARGGAAGQSTT